MANEAVLIMETEVPINFTCDNATGIEKGTLLTISDPMTAAAATEDASFAGIAAEEKIGSDGKTKIAVYRRGVFKMTYDGNGALTVGDAVALSGSNTVKKATNANVASDIIGVALETAATDETCLIELNIGFNNNAYS